jgi:hypothetical protein
MSVRKLLCVTHNNHIQYVRPGPPCLPAGHVEHVVQWIKTAHPFWNRTQGRDHFYWATNDWGVCKWVPTLSINGADVFVWKESPGHSN